MANQWTQQGTCSGLDFGRNKSLIQTVGLNRKTRKLEHISALKKNSREIFQIERNKAIMLLLVLMIFQLANSKEHLNHQTIKHFSS